MGLDAVKRRNWHAVLAGQGLGAEDWWYQPVSGAARQTLRAVVEAGRRLDDQAQLAERVEEVVLTVGRDPTTVVGSVTVGGVTAPRLGDTFGRSGSTVPYSFTGEVLDETPFSWRLRLVRRQDVRIGPGTR